ncbi:S-layer homology domain-containing protein, partial [Flavonifractor plautii]
ADKALTEPIDDIRMTSNKTVYAGWEKTGVPDRLNGDDHFAYIIGRDDGLVHPEATITRAEVATIFFRLLTDEARAEYLTETSPFHDVASDAWYATAVATMEAMGIVEGRAPAVFDPDAPITRGEFAAIAARFDSAPYDGADRFTDIGGHWAAEYINQAAVKGWVEGQPDGSFAPDRSISRAEAMTLVNRVLGRLPETADDLLDGMITWPDNPPDAWYYLAVQEATNSHDYGRKADTVHETWTGLQPVEDWTRYEQ